MSEFKACKKCDGRGWIDEYDEEYGCDRTVVCPDCNGSGDMNEINRHNREVRDEK